MSSESASPAEALAKSRLAAEASAKARLLAEALAKAGVWSHEYPKPPTSNFNIETVFK